MNFITTENAPIPAGHYSQAVVHNGFIFVAGQLAFVPGQKEHRPGSIVEQTEQTMQNIKSILEAAGSGLDKVVQMTIYVSDIALWGEVNTTYARIMGAHKPARAIVPVKELHHGYQIEIQAIATT
jgi:2-iminobutanoate/2-iminopropanoate deaminase